MDLPVRVAAYVMIFLSIPPDTSILCGALCASAEMALEWHVSILIGLPRQAMLRPSPLRFQRYRERSM